MKYELLDEICKPFKKYETDAGVDLKSAVDVHLTPQREHTIPLGIKSEVPRGWAALLVPRSGLGSQGLILRNTLGVIDTDYRGQWLAKVKNRSDTNSIVIKKGDRILQCLIVPIRLDEWKQIDKVKETERGLGGFGHTGKK
jgi:dUTP pyrophosphatase